MIPEFLTTFWPDIAFWRQLDIHLNVTSWSNKLYCYPLYYQTMKDTWEMISFDRLLLSACARELLRQRRSQLALVYNREHEPALSNLILRLNFISTLRKELFVHSILPPMMRTRSCDLPRNFKPSQPLHSFLAFLIVIEQPCVVHSPATQRTSHDISSLCQ
jgi:hypothetical protein